MGEAETAETIVAGTVTRSGSAAGPQPSAHEVWCAVHAKTGDLLLERTRAALLLISISLTFFLIQDLVWFRSQATTLVVIKAWQFAILITALWLIRIRRAPRNRVAFALGLAAAMTFFATAAGIVRGNASGSALLLIVISLGTSIGFPWGARAQAAYVAVCGILLIWSDYTLRGAVSAVQDAPATAAMLTAGLVSIFVARGVERYRFQIEEREMGLSRREEHFRSLLEHGGDLIVVVGEDGRVRYVSPSVAHLLGHAVESWLGRQLFDVVHPDEAGGLRQAMATGAPVGHAHAVELRLPHADGGWRIVDGVMVDLRANAAVQGFVLNVRDATERHAMEADLRRKQAELTHALRLGTIGEIASSLAHEINQPLAAISNYASACVRRLEAGTGSTSELQRGLQLIAEEALRAGHIVHSLRDLSRKGDVGMEMIDVNAAVRRAVELMEPQARLQGVSLDVRTGADLPSVHADAIQIQQVVLNLLLNGIEAMQSIPVRVLSVSTHHRDDRIEVCVRDTGTGLDPTVIDRVFEPYFTTKPTGLGMGLAISRRIVEAHGGTFRAAANADGRGAAFVFSLPIAAPRRVEEPESPVALNSA